MHTFLALSLAAISLFAFVVVWRTNILVGRSAVAALLTAGVAGVFGLIEASNVSLWLLLLLVAGYVILMFRLEPSPRRSQ